MLRLLLFISTLSAVETAHLPVLSVHDGDTITVQADLGGVPLPVHVRLLYLDTPEVTDNKHGPRMEEGATATTFLRELLPIGSMVRLASQGDLERDQYGRVLALVMLESNSSVQEKMIEAGMSVYWRKYGPAPATSDELFDALQAKAKASNVGLWGTNPKWMQDKANERTKPNTP